jgi:hypothetical protein
MRNLAIVSLLGLAGLPLLVFAQSGSSVVLPNPISCGSFICLFLSVIRLLLAGIGLFGLVMFMWGGFLMLTSQGNAERIQKAKETLVWATLGIMIILGSWVLLRFVLTTLTDVTT